MDNVQPFVGIDPDDTAEVKLGGAVFTIGVIDQGLWERLSNENDFQQRAALRRVIRRLEKEGQSPDEVLDKDPESGLELTRASLTVFSEPEYREKLHTLMVRAGKYAVRAQRGFVRRDGQPVPFALGDEAYEDRVVKAVGEETLKYYRANPPIVQALWVAIMRMQTLGPPEKKVSPPQSLATSSSSPAATAPETPASSA